MKKIVNHFVFIAYCFLLVGYSVALFSQNNVNYALQFDGFDDYVEMPDHAAYENLSELTVELWVKRYDDLAKVALVDFIDSANTRGTWAFRNYGDRLRCRIGTKAKWLKFTPKKNQWEHLAFVFKGKDNVLKVYQNGLLIGNVEAKGKIKAAKTILRIGNDVPGGGSFAFNGLIDEVRIWSTTRTQTDIQSTMLTMLDPTQTEGLVGYWSFDEGKGKMVKDATTNNNKGKIYGAKWVNDTPFTQLRNPILATLISQPNPTTDLVKITLPQEILIEQVIVKNIAGQIMLQKNINATKTSLELSLGEYPLGMYLVELHSEQGIYQTKIMLGKD